MCTPKTTTAATWRGLQYSCCLIYNMTMCSCILWGSSRNAWGWYVWLYSMLSSPQVSKHVSVILSFSAQHLHFAIAHHCFWSDFQHGSYNWICTKIGFGLTFWTRLRSGKFSLNVAHQCWLTGSSTHWYNAIFECVPLCGIYCVWMLIENIEGNWKLKVEKSWKLKKESHVDFQNTKYTEQNYCTYIRAFLLRFWRASILQSLVPTPIKHPNSLHEPV